MKVLKIVFAVLSIILISAHLFRFGGIAMLIIPILFLSLLFFRKDWAKISVQVFLVLSSMEWIRTAFFIAKDRMAIGEPWVRMAIILGSVSLFTLVTAIIYRLKDKQ